MNGGVMALAEARAIWQRTANRCLVQEDAKRAPKLTRCSAVSPSVKQTDTGHTSLAIPKACPPLNPSHLSECPRSKWWMQTSPNCGYPKVLMNDQFNPVESNMETCQVPEYSEDLARNEDDHGFIDSKEHSKIDTKSDVEELQVEGLALCEENTPWWQTGDADELALLVAQRSLDCIENCDLPHPQQPRLNKDMDASTYCFGQGRISGTIASYIPERWMTAVPGEGQLKEKSLRDVPEHETKPERSTLRTDPTKAKLLEALCHSQTRAREAEGAAKQASTEKDHIINLVLKQAVHLFAYKQWLRLVQLENTFLQLMNDKSHLLPATLPTRTRKTQKPSCRRQAKAKQPRHVSKYAAVFAVGLGLVGTGFLLGWTVGQMLPTW